MGRGALEAARAGDDRAAHRRGGGRAVPRGGGGRQDRGRARAPRGGGRAGRAAVGRRAGPAARGALLPRLGGELPRALRRRGEPRRPRHRDRPRHRRGTAPRADDAREGLHVRDAGPARGGDRPLRGGGRGDPPVGDPARPVVGAVRARASPRTTPAISTARSPRPRRARRSGAGSPGETMPAGGGGPGWVLSMSLFEAGEVERAWEMMRGLGDDDLLHKIPVERNFDWEVLALVELARGHRDAAESYVRRSEAHAEALGLQLPRALALRGRAALLLADGQRGGGRRAVAGGGGRRREHRRPAAGRVLQRPRGARARRGRRSPAGDRDAAPGRERAGGVRVDPRARRDAPRAAAARRASRAPRARDRRGRRRGVADASASCRSRTS